MSIESIKTDIPRVSVLMTICNAELFLRESIDSLIAQSFHDWELIAVENGSIDASPSILAEYSDPRVRMFRLPVNIGRTPALRYALDQARGEYIAVLDADDVSHTERLARQVDFLDRHPEVAIVGSWALFINKHSKPFAKFKPPSNPEELHDSLGWANPIVHSSAMFRRQSALEVGGYPADLVYAQDLGLILALAQHSKIAMIDDFLCQFRVLSTSMTRSKNYRIIVAREQLLISQHAADKLALSTRARRLNRRAQAVAEIKLGVASIRAGFVLAGADLVVHGIARDPSALWINGPARRLFGINASFMEDLRLDSCAIRAR